jgi:hypothetical protein
MWKKLFGLLFVCGVMFIHPRAALANFQVCGNCGGKTTCCWYQWCNNHRLYLYSHLTCTGIGTATCYYQDSGNSC